jgi:hypothetical protein
VRAADARKLPMATHAAYSVIEFYGSSKST